MMVCTLGIAQGLSKTLLKKL